MFTSYTGKATLLIDGAPTTVMVHVEARHRELVSSAPSWWGGRITDGIDLRSLVGRKLLLELPPTRSGEVAFDDASGNFTGLGPPPI